MKLRSTVSAPARWLAALVVVVVVVVGGLGACAAHVPAPASSHPASSAAPAGQLAEAPASLRPGVVSYPDVPVERPAEAPPEEHHHPHDPAP